MTQKGSLKCSKSAVANRAHRAGSLSGQGNGHGCRRKVKQGASQIAINV